MLRKLTVIYLFFCFVILSIFFALGFDRTSLVTKNSPSFYKNISRSDAFFSFLNFTNVEFNNAITRAMKFAASPPAPPATSAYYIYIEPKQYKRLIQDPGNSRSRKFSASLKKCQSCPVQSISMKGRGRHFWHWAYEKKSLRVYENEGSNHSNVFDLRNPRDVGTFGLSKPLYRIAENLKLIAPNVENVPLFINDEYSGVYQKVEYLLNPSYSSTTTSTAVATAEWRGQMIDNEVSIWKSPDFWEIKARTSLDKSIGYDALKWHLANLRSIDRDKFYLDFMQNPSYMDFIKFAALDAIIGNDKHDYIHNHHYSIQSKRNIRPIFWDFDLEGKFSVRHVAYNKVLEQVSLHPVFNAAVNAYIYKLANLHSLKNLANSAMTEILKLKTAFQADLNLDQLTSTSFYKGQKMPYKEIVSFENLLRRVHTLTKNIGIRTRKIYRPPNSKSHFYSFLDKNDRLYLKINVSGASPVKAKLSDFFFNSNQEIKLISSNMELGSMVQNSNNLMIFFPGVKRSNINKESIFIRGRWRWTSANQQYLFTFDNTGGLLRVKPTVAVTNLISGKQFKITSLKKLQSQKSNDFYHPRISQSKLVKFFDDIAKDQIDESSSYVSK